MSIKFDKLMNTSINLHKKYKATVELLQKKKDGLAMKPEIAPSKDGMSRPRHHRSKQFVNFKIKDYEEKFFDLRLL